MVSKNISKSFVEVSNHLKAKKKDGLAFPNCKMMFSQPQHRHDFQLGDTTPDCEEIRRWRREKTVVQLNVGGERHEAECSIILL